MRMGFLFAAQALMARNAQALARDRTVLTVGGRNEGKSIAIERAKNLDPKDPANPASPMHREPPLARTKARDPNAPRASMPGSVRRRLAREAQAKDGS